MTTPTRSMARMAHSPPSPPPSAARLGQEPFIMSAPVSPSTLVGAVAVIVAMVIVVFTEVFASVELSSISVVSVHIVLV